MGYIYILELQGIGTPRHSAKYYVGWTVRPVCERIAEHRAGRGAAITRAARGMRLVAAFQAERAAERKLKNQKGIARVLARHFESYGTHFVPKPSLFKLIGE